LNKSAAEKKVSTLVVVHDKEVHETHFLELFNWKNYENPSNKNSLIYMLLPAVMKNLDSLHGFSFF
jgi:hypothetical protein